MFQKVSVAMCTYNGEKFIEQQLKSIINQSIMPNEIIICDDCSTDKTVLLCRETLAPYNIAYKIVTNEKNLGYTKNFQNAIGLCSGDIIFLSDQDDVWKRDKIQCVLKEFATHPNCYLVFTDALLVDSNLQSLGTTIFEEAKITSGFLKDRYRVFDRVLYRNFISGSTLAIRKSLFKLCTPIPHCFVHDYWLAIIALIRGEVVGINQPLTLYRQHEENALGIKKHTRFNRFTRSLKLDGFDAINRKYIQLKTLKEKIENHNMVLDYKEEELLRARFYYAQRRYMIQKESFMEGVKSIHDLKEKKYYEKFGYGNKGRLTIVKDIFLLLTERESRKDK